MYEIVVCQEDGSVWASDSMHCRWLRTNEALAHYQAMLSLFGFNPNPNTCTRAQIQTGMFGRMIDLLPWDQRDAAALDVWNIPMNGWGTPNDPAWVHLTGARKFSEQAAAQTAPPGTAAAEAPEYDEPETFAIPEPPKGKRAKD